MLTAGFNPGDLRRITEKLNRVKFATSDFDNPDNPVYNFRYSLMVVYQNAIVRTMGSVKAVDYNKGELGYSGRVIIELQGIGSGQTHWDNLHPATLEFKNKALMRLTVWEATGESKRGVKIHKEDNFVGIDSNTDPEAYRHAFATEYGQGVTPDGLYREWEKRALFTIANEVVTSQANSIMDQIKKVILTYVSWGS